MARVMPEGATGPDDHRLAECAQGIELAMRAGCVSWVATGQQECCAGDKHCASQARFMSDTASSKARMAFAATDRIAGSVGIALILDCRAYCFVSVRESPGDAGASSQDA